MVANFRLTMVTLFDDGIIMSIEVSEKIKLIRESERLTRKDFSELTGIKYATLSSYENGTKGMSLEMTMKLLNQPKFTKYTMWFMTDQISPEAGQIAPVLAHFGQDETMSSHSDKKTG